MKDFIRSARRRYLLWPFVPAFLVTLLLAGSTFPASSVPAQTPPEDERPLLVSKPAQWPSSTRPLHLAQAPAGQTLASAQGWSDIMLENFEASFPATEWGVLDIDGVTNGEYYPAKRRCAAYAGSHGAWLLGGGADGAALPCGVNYPNNANAWMVYGPFDLTNATDANSNSNCSCIRSSATIGSTPSPSCPTATTGAWPFRVTPRAGCTESCT